MKGLVECVPNFSEGRDLAKIQKITDSIKAVAGVQLLSVEPGAATNRTVVTFIGPPDTAVEAAFQAIATAAQVLDMSTHKGEHPRMGATDVCPFVPIEGITMKDCVVLAEKLGQRVGTELGIPVYLYEEAARSLSRKNLADVRRGEYEALSRKLTDPEWKTDFGPAKFNPKVGATAIGVREFLIAYNINLNTNDKQLATELAFEIREKGRVARAGTAGPYYFKGRKLAYEAGRFPCGTCDFAARSYAEIREHCQQVHQYDLDRLLRENEIDPDNVIGKNVYRPGRFKSCKAIGWYVEEFKRAQVSINLTNYKVTPPHEVLEEVRKLAAERGIVVTGSEVVGVIPYPALREAGQYYLRRQGKSAGVPIADLLRTAVFSMGLADLGPFNVKEKVLGLPETAENALIRMTVLDFTDEVSRDTPAPGGGSIAALAGSLGAALASMVANLTFGKEGTEAQDPALGRIAEKAQEAKELLMKAVDEDTQAFNGYMAARRLPKNTAEEKQARERKMQEGLKAAVEVPWRTAEASFQAMVLAREVAAIGNPKSVTDAAVGAQMAYAGVRGGIWNVLINLKEITDAPFVTRMRSQCADLSSKARTLSEESATFVDSRLV